MSSPALELFLARLYTDPILLRQFALSGAAAADGAGLSADELEALVAIDRAGLQMAAGSYSHKRSQYGKKRRTLRKMCLYYWRWARSMMSGAR